MMADRARLLAGRDFKMTFKGVVGFALAGLVLTEVVTGLFGLQAGDLGGSAGALVGGVIGWILAAAPDRG